MWGRREMRAAVSESLGEVGVGETGGTRKRWRNWKLEGFVLSFPYGLTDPWCSVQAVFFETTAIVHLSYLKHILSLPKNFMQAGFLISLLLTEP